MWIFIININTGMHDKLLTYLATIKKQEFKPTSIVQAPVFLFTIALSMLAGATLLWAIFARIPVRVNGVAVLTPVDGLFPLITPGAGSLVYPLQDDNGKVTYKPPLWSSRSYDFLKNPGSFTDQEVIDLAEQVLLDSWTYRTVRADFSQFSGTTSSGAKKSISLKQKDLVAFVINPALDTKLITLVSSIREINRLNSSLAALQKESIIQNDELIKAKSSLLRPLQDLLRKGYSSRIEYLNAQSDVASQMLTKNNTQANLNSTTTEILNNKNRIRSELADYLRSSSIYAFDDAYIAELIEPQWKEVVTGQTVAILGWGSDQNPVSIPLFVNSRAASEVAVGMQTVSTPIGFSVAEIGGIKGRITKSEILPLDTNSIGTRLGSPGIAALVAPTGSAYQFNMSLEREQYRSLQKLEQQKNRNQPTSDNVLRNSKSATNNRAGYIWNNKSNPPLSPRTGMLLSTQITTRQLSPIQMLIPTLKEWSGQAIPKKLQDLYLSR